MTKMNDKKVAKISTISKEIVLPVVSNVVCDNYLHAEDVPYVLVTSLIIALQKLREVRKQNAEDLARQIVDSLMLSLSKTGFPIASPVINGTVSSAEEVKSNIILPS